MRLVIQRVKEASVTVDGNTEGRIKQGFVVLLGVGREDSDETARIYAEKLCKLRIFADKDGKTNLSLPDINGEILLISQFTLYADCHKGNRPNFLMAGEPGEAERLYRLFAEICRGKGINVETGIFGAHMEVALVNDGPFTVILD